MLDIKHLSIDFNHNGITETVVNDCSFSVAKGEILGIVGESGSGKTMTALAIAGLLPEDALVTSGVVEFEGVDLFKCSKGQLQKYQGSKMTMIFQEPMTSLNPLMKIGPQIEENLKNHSKLTKAERKSLVLGILRDVELTNAETLYDKYPHQLSGGMRQRVMIAIAIICRPMLIIADEPTTALDINIQQQILNLLNRIHKEQNQSIIFISHDLRVIKEICNRVLVMKDGKIVEMGSLDEIFNKPKNEYTKELISAVSDRSKRKINRGNESKGKKKVVLKVENLNTYYDEVSRKIFKRSKKKQILSDISFELRQGEILGLVGESGSGKSTLAKSILSMIPDREGSISHYTSKPQMIFQDPFSSLNPVRKIGWLLEEPLRIEGKLRKEERQEKVIQMIKKVGLEEKHLKRYPRELSGGQRQRISIALSLMLGSRLVIADEPVSALDVTVQKQILELLLQLKEEFSLSYLFISHDLNVIYEICDYVMIMKDGRIIEMGDVDHIFHNPQHEYTKKFLNQSRPRPSF